jgi:hypothetical protein
MADANNRHQVIEESREVVVEKGAKLGEKLSGARSCFVL